MPLRVLVPAFSLAALLLAVFWLQPRAMSYLGLNLLFNLAVPVALATIAQMLIIAVNDLDLSIGTFVSFVACVTATFLGDDAAARRADPRRRDRRLCAGRRGHLPARPAVDRRVARHELRLGRPRRADAAGARAAARPTGCAR